MKKLNYEDVKDHNVIDVRSQHDYQTDHVKGSLNLNPGNFKKYGTYYFSSDDPIVFVVENDEKVELENLAIVAEDLGFSKVEGYILAAEVPVDNLEKLETIPVKDFLNKENDYILLDVRHPDEITRPAPQENLVNIPFENLVKDYSLLDKDKEVYTLCGSGNRSTAAASYLLSKGFNPVVIEGGMKAVQEVSQ